MTTLRIERKHARYTVSVGAEITLANGGTLSGATQNLSEGGVGLETRKPLVAGARLSIALFLTQDGVEDPDAVPFEVVGTVMWSAERDVGQFAAGLRFERL